MSKGVQLHTGRYTLRWRISWLMSVNLCFSGQKYSLSDWKFQIYGGVIIGLVSLSFLDQIAELTVTNLHLPRFGDCSRGLPTRTIRLSPFALWNSGLWEEEYREQDYSIIQTPMTFRLNMPASELRKLLESAPRLLQFGQEPNQAVINYSKERIRKIGRVLALS